LTARLGNAAVLAAVIAIGLGLFELACRVVVDNGMQYHIEMWKYATDLKRPSADPAVGHEHRPDTAARLMGADVVINAAGDRGPALAPVKDEGTLRIAMIGDSVTFGWGVAEPDLFVTVLRERLAARLGRPVETANLGVGNTNTAMQVAAYLKRAENLDADVVVLNYFINDAEPPPPPAGTLGWAARRFVAFPVVGGAWDALKRLALGAPDWRDYYRDLYRDGAPGRIAAEDAFRRLAEDCRRRGTPLIVAHVPELHELDPYPFADVTAKVRALADSEGAPFVDMLDALANEPPASLWVSVPDPHPNARAHRLIGERLAERLAEALPLR
jgi:lysophospholipase L1-like esterase